MLNRNELVDKIGETFAKIYWHERGTFLEENIGDVKSELKALKKDLKLGNYVKQRTALGNEVRRYFLGSSQYEMNETYRASGWDTLSLRSYTALWANPEKLEMVSYCEGDISHIYCKDKDSFLKEKKVHLDFDEKHN